MYLGMLRDPAGTFRAYRSSRNGTAHHPDAQTLAWTEAVVRQLVLAILIGRSVGLAWGPRALRLTDSIRPGRPDSAEVIRVQCHELVHLGDLGSTSNERIVENPASQ